MAPPLDDQSPLSRRHDDALLARVDERTENISKQLEALWKEVRLSTDRMSKEIQEANASAAKAVAEAKALAVAEVKAAAEHNEKTYVTKDAFYPVKLIAFGLVGFTCIAVLGTVIALVIRNPQSETRFDVTTPGGTHVTVDPNPAHVATEAKTKK